jgi:hypothetical protein
LACSQSERLNKFPDEPSVWVESQGYPTFSLQEVVGLQEYERLSHPVAVAADSDVSEKVYLEELVKEWLTTTSCGDQRWEIKYNCGVKVIQDSLQSYFVGKEYQPDIWFSSGAGFPLNYCEILSNGDLDVTVGESERTLIDQLRLYRIYDTECTQVCGFVLPASVTDIIISEDTTAKKKKKMERKKRDQQKRRCPLLMVSMTWAEKTYSFSSKLYHFDRSIDLIAAMKENAEKNYEKVCNFTQSSPFFLPVNPTHIEKTFGHGSFQVSSGKSIAIATKDSFYKLIVSSKVKARLSETLGMFRLVTKGSSNIADFVSIPDPVLLDGKFFVSKRLIFPLSRSEALECLSNFIRLTYDSISYIHKYGYVHLDIRLENICFQIKDEVGALAVLIDLECLCESSSELCTVSYRSSMGRMPEDAHDLKGLDWKQFGIVIAYILENKDMTHKEYHNVNYKFEVLNNATDPYYSFVNKLIKHGEYYLSLLFVNGMS